MVRLQKVYGNLMVDLQPTNLKLLRRALDITMRATGEDEATARRALEDSGHRVKVAVVSLLGNLDIAGAERRLAEAGGSVRDALGPPRSSRRCPPRGLLLRTGRAGSAQGL